MNHTDAAELLATYALDAVSNDERAEIEVHLSDCERCRAETDAYLRTASLLGDASARPPEHLWERIAAEIAGEQHHDEPPAPVPLARRQRRGPPARGRLAPAAATLVAAALIAVFAVQLTGLQSQVRQLRSSLARTGLTAAVLSAEAGPHRTIHLMSKNGRDLVTVLVGRDDEAYWVSSSLKTLPHGRTYQLWGLSSGHPVSLALAGRDPHAYSIFRVARPVTQIMVTAEPAGGTPAPTTPVLAASKVL